MRFNISKIFKKMQSLAANKSGATLIEVLISLVLLSFITVTFLNIITGSIGLRRDSDLIKQASALASSKIETIKASDVAPVQLDQTETTSDGYTVRTVYTETSTTLNLTDVSLPQQNTSSYNTPVFELNLNESLSGKYQNTAIRTLDFSTLTDYKFQLNIDKVPNSTNLLTYDLVVNTKNGKDVIKVGDQILSDSTYKAGKITVGPKLLSNIELTVVDNVGEHLQIGIFDDNLNRIQTLISGSNAAVRIESGLLTQPANNQLNLQYYDVVVSVSKNEREYARVLTTWAVSK